jgi:hypothetical protein
MKAISLRQPWAWAVIHASKDVINRPQGTRYRGPLLIHASRNYDRAGKAWIRRHIGVDVPPQLARGGIIGRVYLLGCTEEPRSAWFTGPLALVLSEPTPLPFLTCPGDRGLFEAPNQGLLF